MGDLMGLNETNLTDAPATQLSVIDPEQRALDNIPEFDDQALLAVRIPAAPAERLQAIVTEWLESDRVLAVRVQAEALIAESQQITVVLDGSGYQGAIGCAKRLKVAIAETEAVFVAVQDLAHKIWKRTCTTHTEIAGPLEAEERRLKSLAGTFEAEQERRRRADEARVQAELEARERDARETAALMAEEDGRPAEAETLLTQPSFVPPVQLPKASYVPPVAGASSRGTWKAEVTDLTALLRAVAVGEVPVEALAANQTFLNQQARALKSALRYPGVRVYCDRTMALR